MTSDGTHTYTYDAEGNLTAVDNGATATYVYDALNHRVRTVANGATTEFVFNQNGQRVSVWNGATKTVLREQYYWGAKPVAFYANSATHFQHQDWLGTERARTTYSGAVEGTYSSLPFGDGYTAAGTDQDQYHYAQLDYDTETNTDHAQFRQYSSTQGRWMRPDPYFGSYALSNPQSFNRYGYVMNNPLGFVDPIGLTCVPADEIDTDADGNEIDIPIWLDNGDGQGCDAGGGGTVVDGGSNFYNAVGSFYVGTTEVGSGSNAPNSVANCTLKAAKANGVPLALDAASIAVGFIPGGNTTIGAVKLFATLGVGAASTGYSTATSSRFQIAAANFGIGSVGTIASALDVLQTADNMANGTPMLQILPIVGNLSTALSTVVDMANTYSAYSTCRQGG